MESFLSKPFTASKTQRTSFKVFEKKPITSIDDAIEIKPYLETRPHVGRKPKTPQKDAGCLTDPPVSEPRAKGTMPAATDAALIKSFG